MRRGLQVGSWLAVLLAGALWNAPDAEAQPSLRGELGAVTFAWLTDLGTDLRVDGTDGEAVDVERYRLDPATGITGALVLRSGAWLLDGTLSIARTQASAVSGPVSSERPGETRLRATTDQTLVESSLMVLRSTRAWREGRPPPPWELYGGAGLGLLRLSGASVFAGGWEDGRIEPLLLGAGGALVNFTDRVTFRADLRGRVWIADPGGGADSTPQVGLTFSPSVSYRYF